MSSLLCENAVVAVLSLTGADQRRYTRDVRKGECLSVGSDPSVDVCLVDDKVSATHCMISAKAGVISIRDCFSGSGTFVNGQKIRELDLTANAEIQLGSTVICVTLNGHAHHEKPASTHPSGIKSPLNVIDELQMQLDLALEENRMLQSRPAVETKVVFAESDPYQAEMIELLRAEIVDLQAALAERGPGYDVTSDNYETGSVSDVVCREEEDNADILSKVEAESLVERLEQLLQELQERDEQVATLTELLQAAEEANRAEQEERQQVDEWLRDIEGRFGDREREWKSQHDKLKAEFAAVAAERDRAESAIHANAAGSKLEAAQNVMGGLRETVEAQRQQLQEAEDAITQLRNELERARRPAAREELMQLAEERSQIARLRQELETTRRQERQSASVSEDDMKFKALRQHLNEIHEQERKEKEDRKLSSRIAKLWNRLEGRS